MVTIFGKGPIVARVDRQRRARIKRHAQNVRSRGQVAGWGTHRIAAEIMREITDIRPLEAWRLATGWSRPEVIDGVAALYQRARLAPPPISSSMLCRWEHGDSAPSAEYAEALCRLYQARPDQLGLAAPALGTVYADPVRPGQQAPAGKGRGEAWSGAAAVRESVQLALQAEGEAGGRIALERLDQAARYFDLNYSRFPPAVLAGEIHLCRAAINRMLDRRPPSRARAGLLTCAAQLSALLGNLAYHCADHTAAEIHLGTASSLADAIGQRRILCWTLGAQSMLARARGRPDQALDLAGAALREANDPLSRAQVIAWARLPAYARMGEAGEARDAMAAAQREMDASQAGSRPGRFGFDRAELGLHLAEASLRIGDLAGARAHAESSLRETAYGRPGWAAATLVLARGEAERGLTEDGAELGLQVLNAVPAEMLRDTSWRRLVALDRFVAGTGTRSAATAELSERLAACAAARIQIASPRPSPEARPADSGIVSTTEDPQMGRRR
jgi:hypothetical protein